ncbi:hypothetical protein C8T65DRAFT_662242 [Cerioporus squamosus]|nr:hypothetical protein C8T65DRAFT_662242 [Cerioporus squamosus]
MPQQRRQCLASMARVNGKSFSDPSLRALWAEPDTLEPLFKLLPPLVDVGGNGESSTLNEQDMYRFVSVQFRMRERADPMEEPVRVVCAVHEALNGEVPDVAWDRFRRYAKSTVGIVCAGRIEDGTWIPSPSRVHMSARPLAHRCRSAKLEAR